MGNAKHMDAMNPIIPALVKAAFSFPSFGAADDGKAKTAFSEAAEVADDDSEVSLDLGLPDWYFFESTWNIFSCGWNRCLVDCSRCCFCHCERCEKASETEIVEAQ